MSTEAEYRKMVEEQNRFNELPLSTQAEIYRYLLDRGVNIEVPKLVQEVLTNSHNFEE